MQGRKEKKKALIKLMKADPEKVADMILDLMDQVKMLTQRVSELEQKLALNSKNSSKPPSSDNHKPKPKSLRKKSGLKSGGQKGHKGKSLDFCEQPNNIIEYRLNYCPKTGEQLDENNVVKIIERQVFDLPETGLIIDQHNIYQYKNSLGELLTAPAPKGVISRTQYGKNFYRWLVYLSDYQFIPLNRIRQMCVDLFGYSVSEDTILKARQHCYENLESFEAWVKEALVESEVIHADETGFKVNTQTHWMHTACNARYTYLSVQAKRGYTAIKEMNILERFHGYLVHDCWSTYFKLTDCIHVLCNPHLLRELVFSHEELKQDWAMRMITFIEEAYLYRKNFSEEQRKQNRKYWEAEYRRIIAEGFIENTDANQPLCTKGKRGRKKKNKARNLLERMDIHQDKILAFLWHDQIPFSNNQAEQDVRMVKLKQKISGGFRKTQSAEVFARIRSFISTASKNNIHAWNALGNAFNGNPCSGLA